MNYLKVRSTLENMRDVIPSFLHKIGKIEKSNLIFEGKRKCDNLKETRNGMRRWRKQGIL